MKNCSTGISLNWKLLVSFTLNYIKNKEIVVLAKIRQIIADHKAMNILRKERGDLHLILCIGEEGVSYDCSLFQSESLTNDKDPSKAVLKAYREHLRDALSQIG